MEELGEAIEVTDGPQMSRDEKGFDSMPKGPGGYSQQAKKITIKSESEGLSLVINDGTAEEVMNAIKYFAKRNPNSQIVNISLSPVDESEDAGVLTKKHGKTSVVPPRK